MRRSYKDRMEAMAKMRTEGKAGKGENRGKRREKTVVDQKHLPVSIRASTDTSNTGTGDYDPVEGYNYQTSEYAVASFKSKRNINTPKKFSFSRKTRFSVKRSDVPGPGTYESVNPKTIQQVKHFLPPPSLEESENKTRFRGSILQYLGPRKATEYDFRSAQGWLYASADHALGRNLPGPSQYNLDDEAVRPGTCCGRISTAYPLSEFDIIVNRAAKLPSPMEYYINDDSIRRSRAFGFLLQSPIVYRLGRKAG